MEDVALDPTLTLYLQRDHETLDWTLSSIQVGKDRCTSLGQDDVNGHSRPGVEALCLLILLTYISRCKRPNTPAQIPEEFVPVLKILFDSKRLDLPKWQEDIFVYSPYRHKEDPFPDSTEFLQAFKTNNKKRVRIPENISINVLTEATDAQKSNSRKLRPAELDELCRRLAQIPSQKVNETSVKIRLEDGSYISSASPSGTLSKTSRFSLVIETNHEDSLCIFWLGGKTFNERSTSCLYPHPKEKFLHKMRRSTGDDDVERNSLEITAEHQIEIEASTGVESCLVLERKKKFSKADIEKITSLLKTVWSQKPKALPNHKPRFSPIKIEKLAMPAMGIRPARAPKEWHQKIGTLLSGIAEKAHLFEVPYQL